MSSIISDLISDFFENSDIYESKRYSEIEENAIKLGNKIAEKVDDDIISAYNETRIDFELLFYQYGFVEGIKFLNKTMCNFVDELLSGQEM